MIDLCKIKEDFSVLVKEAQPWTLTQFVMWLDLKLSEFKIKGYMVLDHQTKTKPQWIAADDTSSDVVPSPAPCRQCNKHDTNFYSDIHASPASKRQRQSETVDDSEPIRGEVGVIDLSHAELNRRGSKSDLSQVNRRGNASVSLNRQEKNISRQLSSSANVNRDIGRKETVIEIDPVSPTEKMFLTNSTVSKTSTPIQSYTHNESKHKPPIVGTALYTSTQSSTMPTFSTGHISSAPGTMPSFSTGHISSASGTMPSFSAGHISSVPRTVSTFSSRSFALGAPPTIATTQSQPPTTSNLDEMIAQAVKFNEIRTDPTSSQQVSRMEIQTLPSRVQDNVQISNSSHSSFVEQSHGQNIQQSSPTKPAVPVALHANIDNISREESHSHSSSDITEIKIEQVDTEEECHITDSFFTGPPIDSTQLPPQYTSMVTDGSVPTDVQIGIESAMVSSIVHPKPSRFTMRKDLEPTGQPKQGLVDPETAKAYQMVELVNGSGVYVYEKTVAQTFSVGTENQAGTYNGEKMARFLLNVFWTRKELIGATLSKSGKLRGKKILNQQIIEAILEFCTSHSPHSRSQVRQVMGSTVSKATSLERQRLLAKVKRIDRS